VKHGRLDWFAPEELDEHQRALYDAILEGPRSSARRAFPMTDPLGRFHGPFNAMLVDPVVGDAAQRLGAAVRYGTTLEGRSRELAILEVARLHASDFEFYAHAAVGRSAGLSDDEIAALATGAAGATFSGDETLIREVVVSLVERHDLDDALYAHAVEVLGTVVVADLVVLVGFYEYTALALRVFRVPLPEGVEQTFIGPGGPAGS
jgi:4-carboxymuconolactone decarboxylase